MFDESHIFNKKVHFVIHSKLDADNRVVVLKAGSGKTIFSVNPSMAKIINCNDDLGDLSSEVVMTAMSDNGVELYEPDHIYYLKSESLEAAQSEVNVRQLTSKDIEAFQEFCEECSEEDLDAAYVELEHWLVYGGFMVR